MIAGLTVEHTRGDLYRAALEATAFGVRHNAEAMRAAGADVHRVVAVGGGTRGGLWTRIVSDVTGLEQEIRTVTLGASYGAAFLAAQAVGDADIDAWNPVREQVAPTPGYGPATTTCTTCICACIRRPGTSGTRSPGSSATSPLPERVPARLPLSP